MRSIDSHFEFSGWRSYYAAVLREPTPRAALPPDPPPELMDGDDLHFAETERALTDLRRVNRLLMGYRPVVRTLLPRLLHGRGASAESPPIVVDLGTGSGDVAAAVEDAARRRGLPLRVLGIDRKLQHLAMARRRHPEQWHVVASAEALPLADDAVDWGLSTLFFHHFGGQGNGRILREMRRVARAGACILDLRRAFLLRRLIGPALRLLGAGRVAREDGHLSARSAWSLQQVRALLDSLGLRPQELRHRFPFRFSLVLTRPSRKEKESPPDS